MTKWGNDTIRELELESLRAFVESHRFEGAVLDYGCGQRPYEHIVRRTARAYIPYDSPDLPAAATQERYELPVMSEWDTILCTQVVQYVPDVPALLRMFRAALVPGGALVLTYPTCWREVERLTDLWRFTQAGMNHLLDGAGLEVERHDLRASVDLGGFHFPLGYGVVARRPA